MLLPPVMASSYRLRPGRHRMNDDCMASPDEVRCKHGEVADWCGESECMAARKGLPVRVWRTSQGQVYHRGPACEALRDGQRLAGQFGRDSSAPEQVPLSVAMSEGLAECYHCFPPDVPSDAKPCQVLVGGRWVDGFLLEWRRGVKQPVARTGGLPLGGVRTQARSQGSV